MSVGLGVAQRPDFAGSEAAHLLVEKSISDRARQSEGRGIEGSADGDGSTSSVFI
ncbi:MAG: hypothetical protein ABSD97_15275 [Acidimicrobiales bacterium]|jgi:hypothetical protein